MEEDDNPDFLKVKIMAIREGKNLNDSFFTLEGMEKFKDSFIGKPLLAAFPKKPIYSGYDIGDEYQIGDSHNSKLAYDKETDTEYYSYLDANAERCVGFVPHDSNITIEKIDGVSWLILEGLVWRQYHFELVKDILKKKRNSGKTRVSVEIEVLNAEEKEGIDHLHEWRGLGITLLNDNVQEAIQGANLVAYSESENYGKYKLAMSFALENKVFIEKEKLGSKPALKVDKSRKAMSESAWGDVDKSTLKKSVLMASNWKSACKDVFMRLEEGWEEGKEGSLDYPVMQIKSGTLVYNRYGLASALAYAVKNNESAIVSKIKAIYKKLGLDKEDEALIKEKYSQEGYACFASDEKFAYLFKAGKIFSHPLFAADAEEIEEKEEMAFAEAEVKEMSLMAKVGTEDDGEVVKMAVEEMVATYVEEVGKKFADESEVEKAEMALKLAEAETKFADAEAKFEAEKAEMATQIDNLGCHAKEVEAAKEEMALKLAEYAEAEKEKFEAEANEVFADDETLEPDEKEEMAKKVKDGEFANVEDVKKDYAYRLFKKSEMAKKDVKKSFSVKIENGKVDKHSEIEMTAIEKAYQAVKK